MPLHMTGSWCSSLNRIACCLQSGYQRTLHASCLIAAACGMPSPCGHCFPAALHGVRLLQAVITIMMV